MNFPYLNSRMIDLPAEIDQLTVVHLTAQQLSATSLSSDVIMNSNLITTLNLSATNSFITNLTTANLSAHTVIANNTFTDYNVETVIASKTFTNEDNSKVFHFETSIVPYLSAIFPHNELKDGFNISIFNNGTGAIILSSSTTPFINATGTTNETQNTAIFVYKTANKLYGIGVLE